ncbi:NfeD family protein [Microvirga terrae]|uniref:NfeD family protein n=1 Tax=Microvirga terrae TaxID=2740529 RepID=A0ABY5RS22_9HYPH|nr:MULTISPECIES: NfeD family protein [Microvirga]MBQ0823983.1 NfeD family protein [Microvirga sp. HBU67558]UVF19114.1 NfeD family protein [Microvirga terrae]
MIADAFIGLGAWAWIILGVVLIGIELLAPGSFFLWLGLAAVATGLLDAVLGLSWQAAALLFALLSVGAVILGRYVTRSKTQPDAAAAPLNQRGQSLVGRVFTLETPIKDGEGRIRVDDSSWRVTGADRFAGAKVRVVRVEGATLVVDDP